MEMNKEQQLMAMLFSIADVDGNVSEEESIAMLEMSSKLKDFDADKLREAYDAESKNRSNIVEVGKTVKDDDKAKIIFACANVAAADGIIYMSEMFRLHEVAISMGIPAGIVSYYVAKLIREFPDIKFEDELEA